MALSLASLLVREISLKISLRSFKRFFFNILKRSSKNLFTIFPTTLKTNFLYWRAKSTPLLIWAAIILLIVFAELIKVFAEVIIVLADVISVFANPTTWLLRYCLKTKIGSRTLGVKIDDNKANRIFFNRLSLNGLVALNETPPKPVCENSWVIESKILSISTTCCSTLRLSMLSARFCAS